MTKQARPAVSIVPHSLQAVLDKQPGKTFSFCVTIDIEAEADWSVELVASVPQGINPLIKLLHFNIVRSQTRGGARIERHSLCYIETPPRTSYAEVWLSAGDTAIAARVAIVC